MSIDLKSNIIYIPLYAIASAAPVRIKHEYDFLGFGDKYMYYSVLVKKIIPEGEEVYNVVRCWENVTNPNVPFSTEECCFEKAHEKEMVNYLAGPSQILEVTEFKVLEFEKKSTLLEEINQILYEWLRSNR
jgi:hypothetical protein